MPVDRDMYQRELDLARDRVNAGGPAQAYIIVSTRSDGTTMFAERVSFDMTFLRKPTMAYGCELDPDDAEDGGFYVLSGVVELPQSTGYVTDWDIDDHGHYVGCWVAVQVKFPLVSSAAGLPSVRMMHHFTWSGLAIKALSDATQDVASGPSG